MASPTPWSIRGPGIVLASYGLFFLDDLGWLGYGVIVAGVLAVSAGGALHRWSHLYAEREEAEPAVIDPALALRRAWRHFWLSLTAMTALGAFSLWRVEMTVYRPVAERYYFFDASTWIGRLEHSWFNDALYAFGMVGLLYVLYTVKEFLGGWFRRPASPIFANSDEGLTADQWQDHQQRSTLMIGTGIVIILIWAWLEEIGDLVPGYIFDVWDINAIFVGFILGYSMMHHLSYPVFSAQPAVRYEHSRGTLWLEDAVRLVYVGFVWFYTSFADPSTVVDRWSHIAEISTIVLGSMWLLDVRRRPRSVEVGLNLGGGDAEVGGGG